ncbi:MAG: 3'-5' exoribonuclease YhaM family protein [Beduini sp.]
MKIREIKPGDNHVDFNAIVLNVVNGKTNKAPYLSIIFQDNSGTIDAKLWAATPEQIETITTGKVVRVVGDAIKYNDNVQLKINRIEVISDKESEQVKYLKSAPVSSKDMEAFFRQTISQIENSEIKIIVETLINEQIEKFMIYPAASKNHHEYVSGLAYHTMSMLKLGLSICELYPSLNRDLIIAGVMLHDLGKTIELSGPIVPEYTLEGKLLGHISIAQSMIEVTAKNLNITSEIPVLLKHMVLSHHGKLEYGSPVLPLIKEAEILSLIDNIDARMNTLDKTLETIEPGNFSKRVFSLENRAFYKPKL